MRERLCLLVDDEPAIRGFLKALLSRQNIASVEAETPAQALRLIIEFKGRVDLVISDIQMPGDLNGIDLAYMVRNAWPVIPVILISGFSNQGVPAEFPYVQKPFDSKTILDMVTKVVPALTIQ